MRRTPHTPRTARTLRLLSTCTALAVAAALVPLSAGSASAAVLRPDAPAGRVAPVSGERLAGGVVVGDTALTSSGFATVGRPAARATTGWPVGGGRADLTRRAGTPTGVAAQQLVSAKLRFYRSRGGVMEAAVVLGAAPDASTETGVVLAFGTLEGSICSSPAGANVTISSLANPGKNNPVYQGRTIKVRPFRLPAARNASWNCAFARTVSQPDGATQYDALVGTSVLFKQKPLLRVRISDRDISSQAFTTIPIVVTNGVDTVATAYGTRMKITGRGLSWRFDPAVGTIRPGASRKGVIKLKYTTRRTGYFVITLRSGDYVTTAKYTVTPK